MGTYFHLFFIANDIKLVNAKNLWECMICAEPFQKIEIALENLG